MCSRGSCRINSLTTVSQPRPESKTPIGLFIKDIIVEPHGLTPAAPNFSGFRPWGGIPPKRHSSTALQPWRSGCGVKLQVQGYPDICEYIYRPSPYPKIPFANPSALFFR